MASQRYAQLKKQIADLEAQAEKLRNEEMDDIVARTKEAIATYGLTPEQLFGNASASARGKAPRQRGDAGGAKFSDGKGGVWGGIGKRPQWLRDALAGGAKLEDFAASAGSAATADATGGGAPRAAGKTGRGKAASKAGKPNAKYSDGEGHTWSGMGPKPRWFNDALAAGKTAEDLTIKS